MWWTPCSMTLCSHEERPGISITSTPCAGFTAHCTCGSPTQARCRRASQGQGAQKMSSKRRRPCTRTSERVTGTARLTWRVPSLTTRTASPLQARRTSMSSTHRVLRPRGPSAGSAGSARACMRRTPSHTGGLVPKVRRRMGTASTKSGREVSRAGCSLEAAHRERPGSNMGHTARTTRLSQRAWPWSRISASRSSRPAWRARASRASRRRRSAT
mmetsp:Transcript_14048/g.47548  ORF Transcript_14048/g.47548 Transcript_14048/m.47548 type:complete len:215 (-) Transcript_14048:158-802(-)